MAQHGIDISEGTVRNWSKDYIAPNMPTPMEPQANMNYGFNWQAPRFPVSESLTRFGQGERDYYPNYAEGEKIWNKLYD